MRGGLTALIALLAHLNLANHPNMMASPGNERAYRAFLPSLRQDDQLINLIILIILIIFVKQRTYLETLPDHSPHQSNW
jgi:hypothetical protein